MLKTTFCKTPAVYVAIAVVVLAGTLGASRIGAQVATAGGALELRPYVGAYVPTGTQRDFLKDAVLVGAQASWLVIPDLAITGTFGWSPSKDRITAGGQTLDVYQYDIGAEARFASNVNSSSWGITPFAGLGAGGRTYDYRDLDVSSKTNVAGYGALGAELGVSRLGIRFEARDYVSRFKPLAGTGDTRTRNDVTLATGLTVRF
jgi:hypothetical protein